MNTRRTFQSLLMAATLLAPSAMSWADWKLDSENSIINFVSVKNNSVGEVHSFGSLEGNIDGSGKADITVNVESVETLIEVRNERMREMLFESVQFPVATITAKVSQDVLAAAEEPGITSVELPFTLSLHGQEKTLVASLMVVAEGESRLRVFSAAPILINAADFGLAEGVAALQKIAGLQAISTAVPVTLQLQFEQSE